MILIVPGVLGLAWGGFTYVTRERSWKSDRFTRLSTRHIVCRCLPSQAQLRSFGGVVLLVAGQKKSLPGRAASKQSEERKIYNDGDTAYRVVVVVYSGLAEGTMAVAAGAPVGAQA